MSGTTGHSINKKERGNPAIAASRMDITANTMEIPPDRNTYTAVFSYVEEKGAMEFQAQASELRKDGKLVQNGTVIAMILPEAMIELANNRAKRDKVTAKRKEEKEI